MSIYYHDQQLCVENVSLALVAAEFQTPCYVYSRALIEKAFDEYIRAFGDRDHMVCYAVKACSSLAVLNILARAGAGFDIVSIGELERVIEAGGDPKRVVFSGVAKNHSEISRALQLGIYCFNIESIPELYRVNDIARELGVKAPISLRVNPDIDAKTHPYISTGLRDNKFGISADEIMAAYKLAAGLPGLEIIGIDCHIGSQLTSSAPFVEAANRVAEMVKELQTIGIQLKHIDLGGGLGIRYADENPPPIESLITDIINTLELANLDAMPKIILEPGRSIVGNAGLLLSKVEYLKMGSHKNFAIIDAAMNDMLRPALYSAYMRIVPIDKNARVQAHIYDVVGPVCETGDCLGHDRELQIAEGDLVAILGAGAYGFSMSSNYNSRNRACEVMVDGDEYHLIRARETFAMQIAGEQLIP